MINIKAKKKTPIFNIHPFKFISMWRSLPAYEMVSYFFIYSCIPMLAYGIKLYNPSIIKIILFSIVSLYSGFFAALIWNDITDVDIDTIVHPNRPIPSGRITIRKMFLIALGFSAATFIFSYLVSIWCFLLVGVAALFVAVHNKYLKKMIKFPAYSELLTPVQWVVVPIFGFLAIWTLLPQSSEILITVNFIGNISTNRLAIQQMILLVIFTYLADNAHDLPEGIHDLEGDRKFGIKTYAESFGEKNAARISFAMFLVSGIVGIIIYFTTILTLIFLVPFLCIWMYTMFYSFKLLKSKENEIKEISSIVGRKGFNYLLFSYDLIFVDIFVQLILFNFRL